MQDFSFCSDTASRVHQIPEILGSRVQFCIPATSSGSTTFNCPFHLHSSVLASAVSRLTAFDVDLLDLFSFLSRLQTINFLFEDLFPLASNPFLGINLQLPDHLNPGLQQHFLLPGPGPD